MAKEDTQKWIIQARRVATDKIPGGVWDIETVIGTQRAEHRVNYYNAKYKNVPTVNVYKVKG